MAKETPRYLMRNASIFINRETLIGQASEVGFPTLKRKMEKVFNAGMEVEIEVPMGYDMPEVSFKFTGHDPQTLKLFGLAIGVETEFMATAALVDDDGTTNSMVADVRGFISEVKPDGHKRGDLSEVEYTVSFRYYKLEIGGEPVYEIEPFGVSVGGVSQTAGIRRALLAG